MARIMIVDDETELLELYEEILGVFGHEVVSSVKNGNEALIEYSSLDPKPDLIILDHRMPVRNGLETATEILNKDPDERILFISADPTVKRSALDIGAVEFIEKPFVLKTLRDTIQRILKE